MIYLVRIIIKSNKMKRIVFILIGVCLASGMVAQPKKSRIAKNNKELGMSKDAKTVNRASIMFPTSVAVPEDVVWKRDIYRSIDLKKSSNSALYYPSVPNGTDMNLFTLMFRLLNVGKLPAYEYSLDGLESFNQENRMHFKDMLDRYRILYEVQGNSIKVEDSDIPSSEVLSYYIKESTYFDQNTATFHTRVVALCPVLHRADDFSMDIRKFPLFWVKYSDLEPYLNKLTVMVSDVNNASKMSAADYFATNQYKGEIYMTANMQGQSLQQYCQTDSALVKEQKRIEKQLTDFEENIWGVEVPDTAKVADTKDKKSQKKEEKASSKRTSRRSSSVSKDKDSGSKSSGGSSAPRVSVRRQRH